MNNWRTHLVFFCMAGMMGSLFASRFLLSLFIVLFFLSSFLYAGIKNKLHLFCSSPLLWGMSLLFFLPFISGLWSEDKTKWLEISVRKLPLLLLPLAFAVPPPLSKRQWERLACIFIVVVTAAVVWSLFYYIMDMQAVNASYLRAKSILTPLENDHVRFSWLVSLVLLLCWWLWRQQRKQNRFIAWSFPALALLLCIYLHVLAARTGLFSFYIMVFIVVIVTQIRKRRFLAGAAVVLLLAVLPFLAYRLFPSFKNRVKYILYDYGYFKKGHYLPGGNDAMRTISLKAGWSILQDHPVKGVGAGDVITETKSWYRQQYPGMQETDMIYPSSEWLIYGAACGWPGMVIFTFVMCIPFLTTHRYNIVWLLLNLTVAASLVFDIGLETQFGIFMYSFIVLWWRSWLLPQKQITLMND